jgi:beta-fructofuranosidase
MNPIIPPAPLPTPPSISASTPGLKKRFPGNLTCSGTALAEESLPGKLGLSGLQKARAMALISALLALFVFTPIAADASDYRQLLEQAIAADLSNLDAAELSTLQGLFDLAKGTRHEYIGGKLTSQDNVDFAHARQRALALLSVDPQRFGAELQNFLYGSAATKGGRAYLADVIPSIEMNAPGTLSNVAHQLFLQRGEYAFTTADGFSLKDLQKIDLAAANISVAKLALLARNDETRPAVLPAPIAGWNNDAYLVYDQAGKDIHIFFQHNPFAQSWNHIHWGHLVIDNRAKVSHRPIALEPRPEEGYNHNFSGSISPHKIRHPNKPWQLVTPAFWTAVGTGENGFVSFLEVPPTVMAVTADPRLDTWEAKRFTIHDKDVYKNKFDTINGDFVENRYDMRDPILIERSGTFFLIVAGTAVPGRVGEGVIALLKPSNPYNWAEPWVYVGDMFRHPRALANGGPGILETPNLVRIGGKDVLFFGAQRRPSEGNLAGFGNHEGIEYFVGTFDPRTGKFTADIYKGANGYFEYGRSFYAINATQGPRGKGATYVGWIKGHESREDWNDFERGWSGAITFPTKMTLVRGVPYVELDERVAKLRHEVLAYNEKHHFAGTRLTGIENRTFEITSKLNLGKSDSMTITVLANKDGTVGIPITFDGFRLWVDDEFIPLFDKLEKRVSIRVIVDRSVVIVFVNGKSLTKTVTPPKDGASYADNVVLSTVGSESYWDKFWAYSLED